MREFIGSVVASLLITLGLALGQAIPYSHPCTEDEYVSITGQCAHIDTITGRN